MKKILLIILTLFLFSPSFASEKISYKNLKNNTKMSFDGTNWTTKINKKTGDYFIKKIADNTGYSEFFSPTGDFLFSTGSHYDFIQKGSLIGYSNIDLKFYEYFINNEIIEARELSEEEVQTLFPKHQIIKISDFSQSTNSLKIKKRFKDLKILLLNDTENNYDNYQFTSNNSEFKNYELKGFLKIKKKGMIQFSNSKTNSKESPWYILLVRK